jgi:gliding motility-associated-like protein
MHLVPTMMVFKIVNLSDERILEFKIFNRWGTVLFKDEKNEHWWDGTYKGELQPMGVYGYVIRIGFPDGKIDTYKGTLTLVR